MWPFDGGGAPTAWLALYLGTLALHAVFVSYVFAGAGYALIAAVRKPDDALAARVRDWLPFMLGAGITAGVAPLLFVQLLYQRRFYTANLLMGPRWGAVVPALIIGFYCCCISRRRRTKRRWRIARARRRGRRVRVRRVLVDRAAPADERRRALARDVRRGRSAILSRAPSVAPRCSRCGSARCSTLFATVAAWQCRRRASARAVIAALALAGRAVSDRRSRARYGRQAQRSGGRDGQPGARAGRSCSSSARSRSKRSAGSGRGARPRRAAVA